MDILAALTKQFSLRPEWARNIVDLIDGGNTIPFIARYRKEMTGSASDELLRELEERLTYLRNLEKRKEEVAASIEAQDKLTEELAAQITAAETLAQVEDLYRPYKPKRRTRASIARERGLEPLAARMLEQRDRDGDPLILAQEFVNAEKGVEDAQAALDGACDILTEDLSDDAAVRQDLRKLIWKGGALRSQARTEEDSVYAQYYDYREPVSKIPNHRVLAINRGEREEILKVSLECDQEALLRETQRHLLRGGSIFQELLRRTAGDALDRLLFPALEREARSELTERANTQAIKMFGQNLKATLMQPPVRGKRILALDPGYRTGCKVAVIDDTGKLLAHTVVYPTPPVSKTEESERVLTKLIQAHGVTAIAIGNGTASKETEIFVAGLLRKLGGDIGYAMVSEAGASVYSASKLATAEMPDHDVTVRSAASIGRRLLDPLSELVKIDPKSIGVGLYQHDMPPAQLDASLKAVVEECVNAVGVDLNTASPALLQYVSGVGPALAQNIVAYREEHGRFTSRKLLKKVPKLGPKAFTQCAGFLRIAQGDNPLDNTAVHPESYPAVEKLLAALGCKGADLAQGLAEIGEQAQQYGLDRLAEACGVGAPTLRDILGELGKPGRDVRDELPPVTLRGDLLSLEDLKPGMELQGIVRNVIDFGAFVDIGVHQDGLVHISQICDRYIKHPSEVLSPGDQVTVWVLAVDVGKKRISLTMKMA